jgi:hypothetical protein
MGQASKTCFPLERTMQLARLTSRNLTRLLSILLLYVMLASVWVGGPQAQAATLRPDDLRVGMAIGKFDETWQLAAIYKLRAPRRLRARHLELAVGVTTSTTDTHKIVSLGPVWRYPIFGDRVAVELGFSPTLLSGSTFDGRDMGGRFHFTSSVEFEAEFGAHRAFTASLRIQHTSNGGLNGNNPGMDVVGIGFARRYDN